MKIKIETIYINDSKQDGTAFVDKNGKPFKMANLKFDGKSASMFLGQQYGAKDLATIQTWSAGMEVDIILEESGQYLNFKIPNKTDKELESIKFRLSRIEGVLKLNNPQDTNTQDKPLNTPQGNTVPPTAEESANLQLGNDPTPEYQEEVKIEEINF